jgi:hypothetical protein
MAGAKRKRRTPKAQTEPDDCIQSARFIEAAKALEADEGVRAFQRALDMLLSKEFARKKQ